MSATIALFLKLSPPLRAEDERMALVEALSAGLIDVICSDHDPQDVETKRLPFAEAAAGAIGVETMLSASLRLVAAGPCRAAPPHPRDDRPSGRDPQAAGRQAFGRRAGGRHPLRSGRTLCARSGLASFALPQYALRRGPARGPGQDDAGCRAGRARIVSPKEPSLNRRRLEARMVGISYGGALALALGYCLGSIPFGLVLTKLFGAGDLRSIGSGNIGATNVLRTGRKGLAAATLLLDALKATLAVVAASWAFGPPTGLAAAAGAILGHMYPVWLRFRGGKGVATYLGGLIGLAWPAAIAFVVVWLAVAASRATPPRRPWRRRSFRRSPWRRSARAARRSPWPRSRR